MLTTAPLFASAIAAKSGSDCIGAPAAAWLVEGAALAPCAACALGVSATLEHPPAASAAANRKTERKDLMAASLLESGDEPWMQQESRRSRFLSPKELQNVTTRAALGSDPESSWFCFSGV